MDYYLNLWYDIEKRKNNDLIKKNLLLIMLGLEKNELEKLSKDYKELNRYMEELDKLKHSPEFREYMTYEEDQRKIFNTKMRKARELGLESRFKEGYSQGMKAGIEQKKIEIAKKLLSTNLSYEDIIKVTGATEEKLEYLK